MRQKVLGAATGVVPDEGSAAVIRRGMRARASVGVLALAGAATMLTAVPAGAASLAVSNEAEFLDAIDLINSMGDSANTILLDADFTWDSSWATYSGSGDLVIDGGGHTITFGNSSIGFLLTTGNPDAVTIQDVTFTGDPAQGVLDVTSAYSQLDNVTLTDVDSDYPPVVIHADESDVSNSAFTNSSSALGDAGVIYSYAGLTTEIDNSTFTGNTALDGNGGAVFAIGYVSVTDSTFVDNFAANHGGALAGGMGSIDIADSTFTGNTAANDGGAVWSADGYVGAQHSDFTANSAVRGGAVWSYGSAYAAWSTFSENTASIYGGAVFTLGNDEDSLFANDTFDNNSSTSVAGAIYVDAGDTEIFNSTLTSNTTTFEGAHVYLDSGVLQSFGSVFAGASGLDGCWAGDGVDSYGYNFDDEGSCSDSSSSANGDIGFEEDPQLGALNDNGGLVGTRMPSSTSTLLNAVPGDWCLEAIDYLGDDARYDARGVDRAVMLDGGATTCDIGAVERFDPLVFTLNGPSGAVEFTLDNAIATVGECNATPTVAALGGTPPAGVSFPFGGFGFCAVVGMPGQPVNVWATTPTPVKRAYKVTEGVWTEITSATFSGTTVHYTIVDGGPLDEDGSDDGIVTDPVAFGIGAVFTG